MPRPVRLGHLRPPAVGSVGRRRRHNAAEGYANVSATVYRVKDNGVRCITWPCPSDRETKINGTTSVTSPASTCRRSAPPTIRSSDAYNAMTATDGALVDGSNGNVTGPGGTTLQLVGSNFYTRVAHGRRRADGASRAAASPASLCRAGQWCDPQPVNACGGADLLGACKDPGFACSQVFLPVCGCDGKTYSNDCARVRRQVQLAHDGACAN